MDATQSNHLTALALYDGKKIINNYKALLVLDRTFFTMHNNIQDNKIINNFLKQHRCIMWTIRNSYNEDEMIRSLPFINGQIIGLVENAKNMTYVRYLVRSDKETLALPSILIDRDIKKYIHTGFDYTIDLQNYIISGFVKVVNMAKVFEDINNFLHMWYNVNTEFTEQAASGILIKGNSSKLDYKF